MVEGGIFIPNWFLIVWLGIRLIVSVINAVNKHKRKKLKQLKDN